MKTILLTGSSSGIGKECTLQLLRAGYQVVGISRTDPYIDHERYDHWSFDLCHYDQIKKLVESIKTKHGKVDSLICNAGVGYYGDLEQLSYEHIHQMMDINFYANVYLVKQLLPDLKQQKQGNLIFIGSEAALAGKQKGSIYCASKFAMRGFVQAIRQETAKSHIRVAMIQPGMTRTNFHDNLFFGPGDEDSHALMPEDIAQAVLLILQMRHTSVCEEIILSPMKHVIQFQKLKS